jgi:hypothetical protein
MTFSVLGRPKKPSRRRRFLLLGVGGVLFAAVCGLFGRRCARRPAEPGEAPVETAIPVNGKAVHVGEPELVH